MQMLAAFERIEPGCVAFRLCVPGAVNVREAWPFASVNSPPTLTPPAGDRVPCESEYCWTVASTAWPV